MKNAIEWIKTNPLVTASAVVAFLGLLVIVYFYVGAAPKYSAAKSDMLKEQNQLQNRLLNIAVPLPNEDPNAPPDIQSVVINQVVINQVRGIYSEIQQQYEDILVNARSKNSANHTPVLLGRGEIWPDASPSQFFDLYVRAATDYRAHFKALFDTQSPMSWNLPRFRASSPPTPSELEELLAKSAFEYISSVGAQSTADLSQSQAEQLYAEQRMRLMDALTRRAATINLYVELPRDQDPFAPTETVSDTSTGRPSPQPATPFGGGPAAQSPANQTTPGYPFRIASWALSSQPPTPDQLWEGQVQLWIMRDVMLTISKLNNVGGSVKTMGPDGSIIEGEANVINSPIKRLLKLHTLPGYVGLHNTGAVIGGSSSTSADFALPGSADFIDTPVTGADGLPGASTRSIYPTPPAALAPTSITDQAIEHFGITPTGRVSNSVFDVRHTQLTIDIEAAKIPAFIEALRDTNFITVVKAEITNTDEYELLRQGYVYGTEDVVRTDLVLESLWFRNWTAELMPKLVKEKLLIIPPANALAQPQ